VPRISGTLVGGAVGNRRGVVVGAAAEPADPAHPLGGHWFRLRLDPPRGGRQGRCRLRRGTHLLAEGTGSVRGDGS